jgi:TIM-barrel protein
MRKPKNPSVLAAMAGITSGNYARLCLKKGGAGMVTIGGYPIGQDMIKASKEVARRGRKEFILNSGKEAKEIFREAVIVPELPNLLINLRINRVEDARKFSQSFFNLVDEKPVIEINVHCRQPEIIQQGGGQSLLRRFETISDIIKVFQSKDFRVSLKFRGNAIASNIFTPRINQWQLDYLHIDSYKIGEEGTDLSLLEEYSNSIHNPVIGNNSVVDRKSAQAILDTGAQFFSVARAVQKNPLIFKELVKDF